MAKVQKIEEAGLVLGDVATYVNDPAALPYPADSLQAVFDYWCLPPVLQSGLLLFILSDLSAHRERVDQTELEAVSALRDNGVPWRLIADALGRSYDSVYHQYRLTNPPDAPPDPEA